jgi:hypothetical protein
MHKTTAPMLRNVLNFKRREMIGMSEDQNTIKLNLKAKVVKKGSLYCDGCYFESKMNCNGMYCTPSDRKDKKTIMWVEA